MARDQFIKIRATPEERRAAEVIAAKRGKTVSQLLREHLARLRSVDEKRETTS